MKVIYLFNREIDVILISTLINGNTLIHTFKLK